MKVRIAENNFLESITDPKINHDEPVLNFSDGTRVRTPELYDPNKGEAIYFIYVNGTKEVAKEILNHCNVITSGFKDNESELIESLTYLNKICNTDFVYRRPSQHPGMNRFARILEESVLFISKSLEIEFAEYLI